jgi:biopolymer transport protein ExbB/TolQ
MAMRSSQPQERYAREPELETDAGAWHVFLLDRLQSLRTAVAIVAVFAVAALGVAVWTLLHDDDGGTRRQGVSAARVRALENRVQRLEKRVPSQQDVASLRDDAHPLAKQVAAAEAAATAAQRRADTLDQRLREARQQLRDLQERVAAVERAQAQSGAPR